MKREQLIEQLKNNICEVSFTKVNGESRTMPCTLRSDVLPKQENIAESRKKFNENVVSVWVTDIDQWRSFRVDSVQEIRILEES